jgi:hypothetical protein
MIALSYSRLSAYELCPYKFKRQYIDKNYPDDSDNPAFVRGNEMHKQCDNYIKHKTKGTQLQPASIEVRSVKPIIDGIITRYNKVFAEQKLALNSNFTCCDWFSKATIYRSIIDMLAINKETAVIIDFKSGKVRKYDNKPTGQLHLTACFIFALFPKVKQISTAYLFLDHRKTISKVFKRDEYDILKKTFMGMLIKVNTEKEWPRTKNKYCIWCKLDDCKYCVPFKRSNYDYN